MTVAFVSTYPPRPCGLATFTQDLRRAALGAKAVDQAPVVSMVRGGHAEDRLPEVIYEVDQDDRRAHVAAAEYLNASDVDVVSIQHEFGIFGGDNGIYLLDLLDALEKPVLSTLHTVLPEPLPVVRRVLQAVARRSDRIMVMAESARTILRDVYDVDPACVDVIPHGVPDLPHTPDRALRRSLDAEDRTLLMTFGLLGPTKGIEFALDGLARVARDHPEALFLIVGATHPEIIRRDGEAYREALEARVERLGLRDHVRFVNRYLTNEELGAFLRTTDLYVSPYPGMDQICSGTLAYAVGAGCAVVSTPYLHARELLADERGCLVPYGDVEALATTLDGLMGSIEKRNGYRERAYAHGRTMVWSAVGESFARVMDQLSGMASPAPAAMPAGHPAAAEAAFDYLCSLSDGTGLFRSAPYGIPDRAAGYATEDAAMGLAMALRYTRHHPDERAMALARTCLSFLRHAQHDTLGFRPQLRYDRTFVSEAADEEVLARVARGLAEAIAFAPTTSLRDAASELFDALMATTSFQHVRSRALAIHALSARLERSPGLVSARKALAEHATALMASLANRPPDWPWFEDRLTYANGSLPLALLQAYRVLGESAFRDAGVRTLDFLVEQTHRNAPKNGYFDFIGNRGWYERGGERAAFDQQPIEAAAMAEACATAYDVTGRARYRNLARDAAAWFFGRNRVGQWLFEPATGSVADGLNAGGPSDHRGARAALACLTAQLAVEAIPGTRRMNRQTRTAHTQPTRSMYEPGSSFTE